MSIQKLTSYPPRAGCSVYPRVSLVLKPILSPRVTQEYVPFIPFITSEVVYTLGYTEQPTPALGY